MLNGLFELQKKSTAKRGGHSGALEQGLCWRGLRLRVACPSMLRACVGLASLPMLSYPTAPSGAYPAGPLNVPVPTTVTACRQVWEILERPMVIESTHCRLAGLLWAAKGQASAPAPRSVSIARWDDRLQHAASLQALLQPGKPLRLRRVRCGVGASLYNGIPLGRNLRTYA